MKKTTIHIDPSTRKELNSLRAHSGMTYDQLLNALISLIPEEDDEGAYSGEFRSSLLRSLLDVRDGKTHSSEDVRKELGIE